MLGPLEVVADGRPLGLGKGKLRSLLALLLLHANEVVSSDRLVDELWGERPPPTVATALQGYVHQLRKLLGPGRVETRAPGYRLRVEPGELDRERFDALVAAGRHGEALALWRGPALADLAYEPFAQGEIVRLEELRLAALEERIEAELGQGRHSGLIGELEALVREHPLRERFRAQLMLALYRAGRQAEALSAYRDARQALDELGIEPAPATQQLERAMLRHEAALELEPEPIAPRSARPRTDRLPRQLTSFVGRTRELRAVQALARRPNVRLITLTGPGGAGKTRLALHAATRLAPRFGDGVFFVDLAPVREPALMPAAIADAIGLREVPRRDATDVLAAHLRGRKVLLVLDNFEQLLEAAPLLEELLGAAPALKLLVTSRAPLHAADEHLYPVPPLALPRERGVDLETLAKTEAVALFVERAQAARSDFSLSETNASTVASLCVRLDGLPLALELAAARVNLLSPRAILARVGHWLDLLKSSSPDLPERHRTLRAAIEWSYELLRPEEQALFTNFGVFVGGFTVDGAEAVAAGLDLDVLDGVEALLRASLLRAERPVGDEPRFAMLETIREYALERTAEREDAEAVRRHHAVFYLTLAEAAEPELRGARQAVWLDRLDAEHGNLRAALAWSAERGEADLGLRLGAALWRFWQVRGHVAEGRDYLERLLAKRAGSRAARAAAQLSVARCAFLEGDFEGMQRFLDSSLPVHRKLGDDRSVAFALIILASGLSAGGDHERARSLFSEAIASARRADDAWTEWMALLYLGRALSAAGELTEARRMLEEGLRGMRELGDLRTIGWSVSALAGLALATGDTARARRRLEEALAIQRELGDAWGVANSLEGLASMALDESDHVVARLLLEESLAVARDTHDRPAMAAGLESFARLSAAQGRLGRAARLYGRASVLRETVVIHPAQVARSDHGRHIRSVRTALGDEQFAEAWAQGRAMTLDEALSHALEEEADLELARTAGADT